MKSRSFGWSLGLLVAVVAVAIAAEVQTAPQKGKPDSARSGSEAVSHSTQAPAWVAWRAFHSSLEFYSLQSPDVVQKMLQTKLGVSAEEAEIVMLLGRQYLEQLNLAESRAKEDLRRRLPTEVNLPSTAQELPRMSDRERIAAGRNVDALRSKVREMGIEGRHSTLVNDGTLQLFGADRSVDLATHVASLKSHLGVEAHKKLIKWIESDVMPRVREVR